MNTIYFLRRNRLTNKVGPKVLSKPTYPNQCERRSAGNPCICALSRTEVNIYCLARERDKIFISTKKMVNYASPDGTDEVDSGPNHAPPGSTSTIVPTTTSTSSIHAPKLNSSPPTNALSSADTVLATAGYDHTIKLWQIHTALCVKTFQHPDSVRGSKIRRY
jgi:hypothetical protein